MAPGIDTLVESIRLAGATLFGAALGLVLLGERRIPPLAVGFVGTAALLAGSVGLLIATVAPVALRRDEALLPLAFEYLQATTHGPLLLTPILPAVYALMMLDALRGATDPQARVILSWMLGAAVVAIAVLLAMAGHGVDDDGGALAMAALNLHVISAIAWVALVASLLPRLLRGEPLALILRRWGNVALALVTVLVVSGLVAAWEHGVRPDWLLAEPYGQLIVLKTGVLLLALAAAGWNRFVELRFEVFAETRLRRVLGFEALLLALLLGLAAWLSRTLPP